MRSVILALTATSQLFALSAHAENPPFYVTPVDDASTIMRANRPDGVEELLYTQSHALLIAQSDYENWDKLPAVRQEVVELRNALEKHRFKVEIHLDLKSADFTSVVDDYMRRRASIADSRIVVYVSGHGYRRNLERPAGYIVPVDAPSQASGTVKMTSAAIGLPLFAAWAQSPDPRHMLFIFDSCFSGSFFGRPDPRGAGTPPPIAAAKSASAVPQSVPPAARGVEVSDHIFQPAPREKGRQFITAGSGLEPAPKDSIFTRLIIDILEGKRVASLSFDNWTTGKGLGLWLEQNTRREYRGNSNLTTPISGSLRDDLYENGDIVFSRQDVPNSFLLSEAGDPFPTLIKARETSTGEEASTARAIQKIAERNRAEKEVEVLNREANNAVQEADSAKQRGLPQAVEKELAARQATAILEQARRNTLQLNAESEESVRIAQSHKIGQESAALTTQIDAAVKKLASLSPPPSQEAFLSLEEERLLQNVVNNLSSDITPIRRQARNELSTVLSQLTESKRATATSRLLRSFSSKSYRYQLGVATALAAKPEELRVEDKQLAKLELQRSRILVKDAELAKATTRVLRDAGLGSMTATGSGKDL